MSASIAPSRSCARRAAAADELARAVVAELARVAVAVDHVVDGLEEHAELLAERPPRRLLASGHVGRPQPEPDGRGEQPPGLERGGGRRGDVRAA